MWSGTQGRTGDRLLPKQVRYQAAPLPVTLAAYWSSPAAGSGFVCRPFSKTCKDHCMNRGLRALTIPNAQ